jgi:alpha-mannosidase
VKYIYLHRPGVFTSRKPHLFWWQAPDGAKVLVRNDMRLGYNGQITPGIVDPLLAYLQETGAQDYMFVYGVGDHGGGPTRRDLRIAVDMANWPIFPVVCFSTAQAYYQRVAELGAQLPTLAEELNTEFTGCYTTQTLIKKSNRFAEAHLSDAEIAASFASRAAGYAYPTTLFTESWRDTLFSHFHDILPGSGVHDTRTYTHGLYQKTMATTGQIEMQALRALAAQVDTTDAAGAERPSLPPTSDWDGLGAGAGFQSVDGQFCPSDVMIGSGNRPVLLFNPTASHREEIVRATVWDAATGIDARRLWERAYRAIGPDGVAVATQVVGQGNFWGHDFVTLAFSATVPALGYARYIIAEGLEGIVPEHESSVSHLSHSHHCSYAPTERGPEGLENSLLRLELDPTTGGIGSLVEKSSGAEIIHQAPLLEYAIERAHGMTAWSIAHTGAKEYPEVVEIKHGARGPHVVCLDVVMRIHESDFTLTYELRANDPRVYLTLKGVWFQRGTPQTGVPSLALALPFSLCNAKGRYEIPFGAIDRTLNDGEEVPALQWAQVSGTHDGRPAGCLLLNDSKHGYSLDGNTMRLTLIRGSFDPDILPEIGEHEVHLALQPFSGEMPIADATRSARELNQAIRVVNTDVHAGALPAQAQFVTIAPDNLILSGLKQAEDGEGLIIRLYETAGRQTTAEIAFNRDALGSILVAREVDLLERSLTPGSAATQGNTVTVTVPPLGIASVRVVFGK